ncbi:MAG: hypothetical protein QM767_30065 [Anaeromyxobacter sp.]
MPLVAGGATLATADGPARSTTSAVASAGAPQLPRASRERIREQVRA